MLNLVFGSHFCFGGYFVLVQTVHMNFHAKSGLCSSKNEQVMLNLVLGTGGAAITYGQPMYRAAGFEPAKEYFRASY